MKMKTLKSQMFFVYSILFCVLATLVGLIINHVLEEKRMTKEYSIKNKIAGHLNEAARWQAIERGFGATILGSGEGDSSLLFKRFVEMGKKGDAEVVKINQYIDVLNTINNNGNFDEKIKEWQEKYEALKIARQKISIGTPHQDHWLEDKETFDSNVEHIRKQKVFSKTEWLDIATANISMEFNLRNFLFIPKTKKDKIFYLNSVLRPNIARLCEYAGLERALIANTIASGIYLSQNIMNKINHYRSIVEQSFQDVLLLKGHPLTSDEMEKAIKTFEHEFFHKFQSLREEIFKVSRQREKTIELAHVRIDRRKDAIRDYLMGINIDVLSIANHRDVLALAESLIKNDELQLAERLKAVETLFENFSQINKKIYKIRYIDNSGQEKVHTHYNGNQVEILKNDKLQQKSHRYYFQNAINLPQGKIYLSPFDLNMEYGEIEKPFKPVVRFATPVFVGEKRAGIIILNVLTNTALFLHKITEDESEKSYMLLDQEGFYLHHPDPSKEWGMMKDMNRLHHNIKQDYPTVATSILSGKEGLVHLQSGKWFIAKPIFFNYGGDSSSFLVIVKIIDSINYSVSAAAWFDAATKAIDSGLAISNIAGKLANNTMADMEFAANQDMVISLLLLVFALCTFSFFMKFLKPLQKLFDISQKMAIGNFSDRVHVESSEDEIGKLSTFFNKMADDLQASAQKIIESKQLAEHANRAKSEFLANMSHEIRTPMNAIMGLAQLALKTDLTYKQQDYLTKIELSSKTLLNIINDILDFSKIEAGMLSMETVDFHLDDDVLNNIAALFGMSVEQKGLELLLSVDKAVPYHLIGDPLRLNQILVNLTTNAIKFTQQGEIIIKISVVDTENDKVTLLFSVQDSGIGISQENIAKLFKAFSQADSSTTRNFGGTGLGLTICKRLTEMMEGKIWIESELGKGSTFYFTATFCHYADQAKTLRVPSDLQSIKILIVDDNEKSLKILHDYVSNFSFEKVHAVNSGKAALHELETVSKTESYDVVLLDWTMPDMNGTETAKRIKENFNLPKIPLIMAMTAFSRGDILKDSKDNYFDAFISKPVTQSSLFEAIMAVFGKRIENFTVLQKKSKAITAKAYAIRGAHILLVEDNSINQEIAREIMENEGLIIDTANNGKEAVTIVAEKHFDAILMDIQMPEMDGYEASRFIRKELQCNLPIIAMTAHAMSGDKEKSLAAGMDDYITKPIDVSQLLSKLTQWITPKDYQMTTNNQATLEVEGKIFQFNEFQGIDVEEGLKRLCGVPNSHEFYFKLLKTFYDNYHDSVEKMKMLLEQGDSDAAQHFAHTLKGVCGNLSINTVYKISKTIDVNLKAGNEIKPELIEDFEKAVSEVMKTLVQLCGEKKHEEEIFSETTNIKELKPLLKKMRGFLEECDCQATDFLPAIKQNIGNEVEPLYYELREHIERYDFEKAQKTLNQITQILNLSLTQ